MAEEPTESEVNQKVNNLTIHGFTNAYAATSFPRRYVWVALSLVALGFCLVGIITSAMTYNTYPVKVEITYEDESLSYFPAVTICNLNRERRSQTDQRKRRGLYGSYFDEEESDLREQDTVARTGHQIQDMLLTCMYKEMTCRASHFIFVNGSIGLWREARNCFTFNSILQPFRVVNELLTGRQGGMYMTLDTEQQEYLPDSVNSGFIIMLHDPALFPTPETKTVSVSPGDATFIELTLSRLSRAPIPYGACEEIDAERNKQLNIWAQYGYNYSVDACKHTYIQLEIIKDCGCAYDMYPIPDSMKGNVSYCAEASIKYFCMVSIAGSFANTPRTYRDVCPPPCEQSLLDAVVSSHTWPSPSEDSADYIRDVYHVSENETIEVIRSHLLQVAIYFEGPKVTNIIETPMFDIFNLLSEFGGHLGLWVGLSMLALVELLEIAWDFAYMIFHRK